MAHYVSKEGVWTLITGGRSETPMLEIPHLQAGQIVKITVNFYARTGTNDNSEGFYFHLGAAHASDVTALTPSTGLFQGDEGWKSCVLVALFEVQGFTEVEADFELTFTAGDLNPRAQLSNFVMVGEILS